MEEPKVCTKCGKQFNVSVPDESGGYTCPDCGDKK